jgi:hypothetical protein
VSTPSFPSHPIPCMPNRTRTHRGGSGTRGTWRGRRRGRRRSGSGRRWTLRRR